MTQPWFDLNLAQRQYCASNIQLYRSLIHIIISKNIFATFAIFYRWLQVIRHPFQSNQVEIKVLSRSGLEIGAVLIWSQPRLTAILMLPGYQVIGGIFAFEDPGRLLISNNWKMVFDIHLLFIWPDFMELVHDFYTFVYLICMKWGFISPILGNLYGSW